tara:strand:- start:1780 stop:2997 length:1218 start_codon:yes stop_codon:yes gene_type:complete
MGFFKGFSSGSTMFPSQMPASKSNGTYTPELENTNKNNNDKTADNGKKNGKKSIPRHFSHPTGPKNILSYPLAIGPDESNGSRLLIKCFEYVPPKTTFGYDKAAKFAKQDGTNYDNRIFDKGEQLGKIVNGEFVADQFAVNMKLVNEGASTGMANKKSLYYIELPVPQDVNDQNSVTWGDNSMNILQLAGIAAVTETIKNPKKTIENFREFFTQGALSELGEGLGMQKNAIAAAVAGRAIDPQGRNINANAVIGRTTGQILNNNLELLFDSVNLRSFPFSITFSPRNELESRRVIHIIRALKSSMAAKNGTQPGETGQGGIFLKAPDVFHLRYLHNGKDHPFLNSFKHCALTAMSVNYTNAGTFASYGDGTPVSIQLNMTFKELNPIYNEDYRKFEENDNLGVGY